MHDVRKNKLINALKQERAIFEKNGHSTYEHDVTIKYLETGETDESPDDYAMLDSAMFDFETICSDYRV